ncbi:neuraminidase-like domain-containing protein [Sorangium sp. So ce307]|uniref:neuraminidase-like domain-containing protein n=1 Tax=Sorangium sp. So ce307 TaxID=3133298 RepID=UPI003F61588C
MAFTLAQGTLSLPAGAPLLPTRVTVISAIDGRELHKGVQATGDGSFRIDFPDDPRALWRQSGVEQIAFIVQRGSGPVMAAREPSGRVVWGHTELPLEGIQLIVPLGPSGEAGQTLGAAQTILGSRASLVNLDDAVARFDATAALGGSAGEARALIDDLGGAPRALGSLDRTKPSLSINSSGADVKDLQDRLLRLGYHIPAHERAAQVFGAGTREALWDVQAKHDLSRTGVLDEATQTALASADVSGRRVEGRLSLDSGAPARGVTVRLYQREFGGTATLLGEVTTDEEGFYAVSYDLDGEAANLEVRVVAQQTEEISLTATKPDAERHEIVNLVAPARVQPLAAEYRRLAADLENPLGGIANLATAREDEERQDVTLLHRTTGWDARIITLAALAAQRSATTGIPQEALYALFRVGLPTDEQLLAGLRPSTVDAAIHKAVKAGLIGLDSDEIAQAKEAFTRFAQARRLSIKAPGTTSSVGELLAVSGLKPADQETFGALVFAHRGMAGELWKKAGESGLPVKALKYQGMLAYLTRNNAAVVASLQEKLREPGDTSRLIDQGLYRSDAWKSLLDELSGGDPSRLDQLIPPAYAGDTPEKRAEAYAVDMARKVRTSAPTQVVRRMIETDELSLGAQHAALKQPVRDFLESAASFQFKLGQVPLGSFIASHQDRLFPAGTPEDRKRETVRSVKQLHRLYQISPTDDALKVLLSHGFTSAHDVLSFSYDVFLERFGGLFGSPDEARLVYRKAQQVSAVTYGFFGAAEQLSRAPAVFALSPGDEARRRQAADNLLKQYPTMESLFGSLDFCECEHCRSVLSPAAYFVDLLQLVDPGELSWQSFLTDWKGKHGGSEYTSTYKKPYDALIERRPDLPHLPLTCENTHTALPYIDLVNEILEVHVVHGRLAEDSAHDTGAATTPELLAEPHHILPAAYDELKKQRYPSALPFDLWLETVRRYLAHCELPLWQVLEALRTRDDLFVPPGDPRGYGRAAIFAEYLGIGPDEYAVFIDPNPQARWFELYGYTDEATALNELRSAKRLSRRLGVTYKELVEFVRTEFINPTPSTLVLADPDASCDFERTTLQHQNGTAAGALDFIKISLFVRLFRKLGWTIEETDRALAVLVPKRMRPPRTGAELGAAMQTALVYLAHLKALEDRLDMGNGARVKLLTLWADLPTRGNGSLYAQLFLTPSVAGIDPAFDDATGNYLSAPGVFVAAHLPAIQAALGLTADEIELILKGAGKTTVTAELSLPTVSLLYRHGLLAKALKLSVRELLTLKALSGIDPFAPLREGSLATTADDRPLGQTLRFVEIAGAVQESGFGVGEIAYLLLHQVDPTGAHQPDPASVVALVRSLSTELRRVRAEHAAPADPAALTDDWLTQKLELALPPDVATTLRGMWTGTIEYAARREGIAPESKLDPAAFVGIPELRVTYDEVRRVQRLAFRGVLLDARRREIEAAVSSPVLPSLLDDVQGQARSFFSEHLARRTIDGQSVVGFLDPADFDALFAPIPAGLPEADRQSQERGRRTQLASAFLPYLEQKLVRQFLVQATANRLGADAAQTEELLRRADVIADPSTPGAPLVDALMAAGERGATVEFFASADGTGNALAPRTTASTVDTTGKPAGANSARFKGYLEVPAPGAYRFFIAFGMKDAEAELRLGGVATPVVQGTAGENGTEISEYVELEAGVAYPLTLDVRRLGGGDVALLVQGESLPKGSLARLSLTPDVAVERLRRAHVLLEKTLRLMTGFGLSERELRYLRAHAAEFDGFDPGLLPTSTTEDIGAASARFAWFLRLVDYARLKRELGVSGDEVVQVLSGASSVATLLRRTHETVSAMMSHLGLGAGDIATERGLRRLWEALRVVEKLGAPVDAIVRWATPAPDATIARELTNAVKARHGRETWLRIAPSLSDDLRRRRRDALVASVMARLGFEQVEQLFEYFLIDPAMEPVVQTSRLRLAISSVQTFVQRCLLNLEPAVHPTAVDAKRWQWMKRYRVWEANRKMFLFPENWLEPELRDDKTHLFEELEGALLQGDVSNDLAEDALFRYLRQLEELARLEIVAMYAEEKPGDPASNVLHVIGRTHSLPSKYFYRRYAYRAWTPWEPVTAEIEGDHVVAVMWRERLHLFWVTFLEKADDTTSDVKIKDVAEQKVSTAARKTVEIQLNWSEYFQGQWSTRASGGFGDPTKRIELPTWVDQGFDRRRVHIHVSKEYEDGEERAVLIHLDEPISMAFRVVSKNGRPTIEQAGSAPAVPYAHGAARAGQYLSSGALSVTFTERIETEDGKEPVATEATKTILRKGRGVFSLLGSGNALAQPTAEIGALVGPFFYQDSGHTFFVEPTLTEITLDEWEEWAIPPPSSEIEEDWWNDVPVTPSVPRKPVVPPAPIDPRARYQILPSKDWLTSPVTVLQLGDWVIEQDGGIAIHTPEERPRKAKAQVGAGGLSAGTVEKARLFDEERLDIAAAAVLSEAGPLFR